MVPESQDAKTAFFYPCSSCHILSGVNRVRMLAAIEFNHQSLFQANKIYNEPTELLLPAEFMTG